MKKLLIIFLAMICIGLTGCGDDMKEEVVNDFFFTVFRCNDTYYVAGSSMNKVYIDWNSDGEYPSIDDGEFAVVNADIVIRTGGEAGYCEDIFINMLKSYEIKSINDVINENLLTVYTDGIIDHNGLKILEIGKNVYYIQNYNTSYRVYMDGKFQSEITEDELELFEEQLLIAE